MEETMKETESNETKIEEVDLSEYDFGDSKLRTVWKWVKRICVFFGVVFAIIILIWVYHLFEDSFLVYCILSFHVSWWYAIKRDTWWLFKHSDFFFYFLIVIEMGIVIFMFGELLAGICSSALGMWRKSYDILLFMDYTGVVILYSAYIGSVIHSIYKLSKRRVKYINDDKKFIEQFGDDYED
jgi:hypothetical protein